MLAAEGLKLYYRSGTASIKVCICGRTFVVETVAKGPEHLTGFQLQAKNGDTVIIQKKSYKLGKKRIAVKLNGEKGSILIKGKAKIEVPSGSTFVWPLKPHNPYTFDSKTGINDWLSGLYMKNAKNIIKIRT